MRASLWWPKTLKKFSRLPHCFIEFQIRTVVVDQCTDQLVLLQHGKSIQGLGASQEVAALESFATGKDIVELAADPVVGDLPPSIARQWSSALIFTCLFRFNPDLCVFLLTCRPWLIIGSGLLCPCFAFVTPFPNTSVMRSSAGPVPPCGVQQKKKEKLLTCRQATW